MHWTKSNAQSVDSCVFFSLYLSLKNWRFKKKEEKGDEMNASIEPKVRECPQCRQILKLWTIFIKEFLQTQNEESSLKTQMNYFVWSRLHFCFETKVDSVKQKMHASFVCCFEYLAENAPDALSLFLSVQLSYAENRSFRLNNCKYAGIPVNYMRSFSISPFPSPLFRL